MQNDKMELKVKQELSMFCDLSQNHQLVYSHLKHAGYSGNSIILLTF